MTGDGTPFRQWRKVSEILTEDRTIEMNREHGHDWIGIVAGKSGTVHYMGRESTIQRVRNESHRKELLAEAVAYQGTLTKAGKPRKRRAAKGVS